MQCPVCHRDTFSKKWQTCSACDRERAPLARPGPPAPAAKVNIYATHIRTCAFCGVSFQGTASATFCGGACRQASWRAKNNGPVGQSHLAVLRAIRTGALVRPDVCENCGHPSGGVGLINAHHDDYSKPLSVRWLCGSCHKRVHNGNLTPGQRVYSS